MSASPQQPPHPPGRLLPFPVGTQVVTLKSIIGPHGRVLHPRGAVGVVVQRLTDPADTQTADPTGLMDLYRVRFPDAGEQSLRYADLTTLAKFTNETTGDITGHDSELFERVIFQCIIGSQAYGLASEQSDIDRRGIYLPPAHQHWSLTGVPEQLECHETQETYWELQKFLTLALKANPNVLECLYSPLIEKATPLAEQLLAMRNVFLSRLVYQTYNGYVMSQFKKMQADIRNQGQVKWKHVMHLIRLLLSGIDVLRNQTVTVRVDQHREQLLAIKQGEMPWAETERWRLSLHQEFDLAFQQTRLPQRPDYEQANRFLIQARTAALQEQLP